MTKYELLQIDGLFIGDWTKSQLVEAFDLDEQDFSLLHKLGHLDILGVGTLFVI